MIGQVNSKVNYLILFLLFSCIKLSVEDGLDKIEQPTTMTDITINGKKLYQIALKNETNLTFTKIEVKGEPNKDFIISYYKDDFKNRKQLSKSISGKALMWLNKAQMQGVYNISIECDAYPCKLSLSLELKDKIEINLGDAPYAYYVTKDNKEVDFHIKGKIKDSNPKECKISIWAKGNKNIVSSLSGEYTELKNRGYQAYLINKIEQAEVNNRTLKVNGNLGDLIEVGALAINVNKEFETEINFPVLGFFKKDVLDTIKIKNFDKKTFAVLYDQENSVYPISSSNNDEIKMDSKYGDKYFYSFDYKKERTDNFYNILTPLIHGAMYEINLEKEKALGLIHMAPEDNFDYLTYYAKEKNGEFTASILSCKNYPLCAKDEKETPLLFYDSSSFIYKKDKYENDISPISHKQNVLLLKCKSEPCKIYVNMYTNKNKVTLSPDTTLLKNIKENTEENFIIGLSNILPNDNTKYVSYLNVETLSGDISVEMNGTKFENGNKKLFEKDLSSKDSFSIKIKAKKNSFYNIAFYYEKENTKFIPPQANCLIKFKDDLTESQFSIRSKEKKENLFVSLSFLKSNTSVEKSETKLQFNEKGKFVQDSYENNEKQNEPNNAKYKVKRVDNKSNPYLYSVSTFRFYDEGKKNTNYVLLGKGVTHPVLFDNSKYKKISYMYLYEEENDNLKVNFTIFDDKKYNVEIEFNDKNHQSYNNISKNNSCIELSKDVLKNNSLANQPCKINFIVSPQEYNNNPIMEITINPNENSGSSSKSSSGGSSIFDNKILLIGGGIILVLLIILIIAIGLLCYTKNVNKDLKSKITSTSFKDGGTGATEDDDKDDELLS